jgi:hypothetical protein
MVRMNAADGDAFFEIFALNVYISLHVGANTCEWSFSRGGEFCFLFALI